MIFDAVGKQSFRRCRRSLKPGGVYVTMDLGFMYHVPLLALGTDSSGASARRSASAAIARRISCSSKSSSTRESTGL